MENLSPKSKLAFISQLSHFFCCHISHLGSFFQVPIKYLILATFLKESEFTHNFHIHPDYNVAKRDL